MAKSKGRSQLFTKNIVKFQENWLICPNDRIGTNSEYRNGPDPQISLFLPTQTCFLVQSVVF